MTEVGKQSVLAGVAAADGLIVGQAVRLRPPDTAVRVAGPPAFERESLEEAIGRAAGQLEAIAAEQDELGAEILEFQSALLDDEELLAPVFAAIDAGRSAQDAWSMAIDGEIAEYRAGDDTYFQARADDLGDLRDRVLAVLSGSAAAGPSAAEPSAAGDIAVADDLTPSRFLELDWGHYRGAAIRGGSPTSHVAILARARGIPLVVGLRGELDAIPDSVPAVLDVEKGRLVLRPNATTLAEVEQRLRTRTADDTRARAAAGHPALTASGEPVRILINVDDPAILRNLSVGDCDGIGLTRTEFLFHQGALPDETRQFETYRDVIAWARGRPVTIRTLDAGGDKPIAGVTPDGELNPFLGLRGARLSLSRPEIFSVQLRALARAAVQGPLKVMIPMVTLPEELDAVRALLGTALDELAREGIAHARPQLGMMVEVPSAALMAERFDADFFSIGSNDLIQYTTACARDNPAVTALANPDNPAVLELIRRTVDAAGRKSVEVSLCGDMASDPSCVPDLLDCGLRQLSVSPAQIGRVKLAVGDHA